MKNYYDLIMRYLLILILIVLSSCDTTTEPSAKADINGHAFFASTTIPLSGVLVSIGSITSTTGGNGEYTLHNIDSGWNTITATKNLYDTYSESINIPEEGLTKDIEMTAQTPWTLSGTVYDGLDPGVTLSGVAICVLNPDLTNSGLITSTDLNGTYLLSNVPQQSIMVNFSKEGYENKIITIAMANYNQVWDEQLSQTSGHITTDKTWSGNINITGDLIIDNGIKLTILYGSTVKLGTNCAIIVNGVLEAQGIEENMITFTSSSETPSSGDWAGISFNDTVIDDLCIVEYCRIYYANNGIYCHSSSPNIINNIISYNENGIYCYSNSKPNIFSNSIKYNNIGIYDQMSSELISPIIRNNVISNNTDGVYGSTSRLILDGNIIHNNQSSGIELQTGGSWPGSPGVTIENNIIYDNFYGINFLMVTGNIINNTIFNNWHGIYNMTYINYGFNISNCILWDNGSDLNSDLTATFSNIEDGDIGTGNISLDPLFVNSSISNFHLQPNSPCIDSATSDNAPNTDIEGNPRYDDPNTPNTGEGTSPYYDMGAYEYQGR